MGQVGVGAGVIQIRLGLEHWRPASGVQGFAGWPGVGLAGGKIALRSTLLIFRQDLAPGHLTGWWANIERLASKVGCTTLSSALSDFHHKVGKAVTKVGQAREKS